MTPARVGLLDAAAEEGLRLDCDGSVSFHPDCVAYPDDESAYTGVLDLRGYATMEWVRGGGLVDWENGVSVSVGDAVYEAVQRGLIRVGVRKLKP